MSKHIMITRSKKYIINDSDSDSDDIDEDGNLKNFIVNDLKSNNDKIIIRKKEKTI